MTVRRLDIEGQAKRLRLFVSEAVRAETGNPLPMTQTLDQMVRAAAKAGVSLHFSTDSQADAVQQIHGKVLQLKAENEAMSSLMAALISEIPHTKNVSPGNSPGHSHRVPGIWDEDNGPMAGKECGWCKVWNAAVAMAKELDQ